MAITIECFDCGEYQHLDFEDILNGMSLSDMKKVMSMIKQELNSWHEEELFATEVGRGIAYDEFLENLSKISYGYHSLTQEETDVIAKIASRF